MNRTIIERDSEGDWVHPFIIHEQFNITLPEHRICFDILQDLWDTFAPSKPLGWSTFSVWERDYRVGVLPIELVRGNLDYLDACDYYLYFASGFTIEIEGAGDNLYDEYLKTLSRNIHKMCILRLDDVCLPKRFEGATIFDFGRDYEAEFKNLVEVIQHRPNNSLIQIDLTGQPTGGIIEISGDIGQMLIRYFAEHPDELKRIDSRRFEEMVAELFGGFGYEVELTKKTRDGGRDIIAIRRSEVLVKYLIECKRPDPGGYVSIKPVRELFGVKQDEKATKAILATTAHFSPDALLFFQRNKWELEPRDYYGLLEWIQAYLKGLS